MAAIEKGIPPQQIIKTITPVSPQWIKSLTRGIVILLIAVILLTFELVNGNFCLGLPFNSTQSLIALILLAIGLSLVIRSLLLRKAESQQNQASKNIPPNGVS
jgi:predicted RND superfamily exporter protein